MVQIVDGIMKNLRHNKFVFLGLTIILLLSHYTIFDTVDWPIRYMLLAFAVVVLLMLLIDFQQFNKMPRNAFWIIFVIGALNCLILPAGTGLDEQSHYSKAMQIADGRFMNQVNKQDFYQVSPDAAFNPEGQVDKHNLYSPEWLQLKHVKSDYSVIKTKNYNLANPVFIPSAIGIRLGRLLSPKVYISYYLGRIFNILALAIMAYIAIKKSKRYQIALFGASTLPICLWISAAYSYDAFYYGLSLLAISWLINMFDNESKIRTKDIVWYSIFSALLILCKPPMILIIFLPLVISKSYYQSLKSKYLSLLPMGLALLAAGLWMVQSKIFALFNLHSTAVAESTTGGISNLTYFRTNLVASIEAFMRTFFHLIGRDMLAQIQAPNAHLAPPFLPKAPEFSSYLNLVIFIFVMILISFAVQDSLPRYFKYILILMNFVMIGATIYAIAGDARVYTQGDNMIGGVQGRYMFILLAMIPALLSGIIKKIFIGQSDVKALSRSHEQSIGSLVTKVCLFGALFTSFTYIYLTGYLLF